MHPALLQVLLSLNIKRKLLVEDSHKLVNGISYMEATSIDNKWTEWSRKEFKLLPADIEKNIVVTHVTKTWIMRTKILKVKKPIIPTRF